MHPHKARAIVNMRLTRAQELEQAVRERPSHVELNLELAELYFSEGRGYEAVRLLEKALAATGRDARIEAKWEEAVMRQARQKVLMAERRVATDPTSGAADELDRARRDRDKLEQEIFERRCEREPDNLAFQLELGVRLARRGQAAEAMQRFEAAMSDPDVAAPAALAWGEALADRNEIPQALSKFRRAAAEAKLPEQAEIRRQALYKAGRLAEEIRLAARARHYYRELLADDPLYEDAAQRLAALPEA
jgi:Tfp pilus assembly protein PilF